MRTPNALISAAVLTGLLLAGPAALVTALGHARPALAAAVTAAPDEAAAAAAARSAGAPVEALSDRTPYAQVFANPGGTFSFVATPVPQRVQNPDGSWSGLDTALRRRSDGSLAPGGSLAGLVLSGGGAGPMLTVTRGSRSLSLTWPDGALPAPALSGATATYAGVLPGVDLVLTATATGVSQTLVVGSAQAAANPALGSIAFGLSASGLTLTAGADGGMTASDPVSGAALFDVPAPQVWDSAGGSSGPDGAGPVANRATAPITLAGGTLTISPSPAVLRGSGTVYPVYVDPEVTVHGASAGWLDVGKNTAGQSYGDWEPTDGRVGAWCQPDSSGNCPSGTELGVYRTYFDFPIPQQIWGAQQVSATLFTNETWSWSCSASEVDLYQTGFASKGATWNSQPARGQFQSRQNVAYGWSSSCPSHGVSFDASGAARSAAGSHWTDVTLELQATDSAESSYSVNSWKRFQVNSSSQPFLQIVYDHAPDAPTNTTTLNGTSALGCAPGTWVSTTSPSLQARIAQPDGSTVRANFSYTRSGGGTTNLPATSYLASGSTFTVQTSGLADGAYTWNVSGFDGTLTGPSSSPCSFGIDTSPPATPTIGGQSSMTVGAVSGFTFSDPANADPADGVNDVAGYRYGFSDPPVNYVAAASEGGSATIDVSPVWLGSRTLYVRAVDRAGNLSPSPSAQFAVTSARPSGNPTPLLAEWKLNEGSGTTAADATGDGHDATLGAQAAWGAGPVSGAPALSLTGAGDSEAVTAAQVPPVDNTGSFTVSAWVNLSPSCASTPSSCGFYDAVSMDGATQGAFALEYVDQTWCAAGAGDGVNGCWAFTMPGSDTMNPPASTVEAATPVTFGTWVHLTGVYDQVHQTIQVYVNGQAAGAYGTVAGVQPWAAPAMGPLRIGRVLFNGAAFNWWPGRISDVCTFWGALDATQVQNVYTSGCASAGAP
jgi:Concanavalin A-like lectin/glucanases superfamily